MDAEAANNLSRKRRSSSEGPFPVRVRLLGGFSVWVGSHAVGEGAWHLRKARSLVKLLTLAPGHALHREQIILEAARSRLDEEAWEKAFTEGRAMGMEEAVEYAPSKEEETDPLTSPAPEEPSAGQAPVALTRREKEVAALVSQGLTNRQIAKELVLSERTVENHVAHILKKLALRSRAHGTSRMPEQ
jgi:DNA-binding CsgD family transcriptional regulator